MLGSWDDNGFLMPETAAASIFAVTPPIGRTSPLTEREPVIAKSCRIVFPLVLKSLQSQLLLMLNHHRHHGYRQTGMWIS